MPRQDDSGLRGLSLGSVSEQPRCGRCKQPLFTGEPATLTASNFHALVASSDLPVVVDVWAAWCGPCKMMAPIFADTARALEPRIRFATLDTEAEAALAGRFGIRSIPTLIVFRRGEEIDRRSGVKQGNDLRAWLQPYLIAV